MAKGNSNIQLLALGALGFFGYQALPEATRASLRRQWDGLFIHSSGGGSQPSGGRPSGGGGGGGQSSGSGGGQSSGGCDGGWMRLLLWDLGAQQVEWKPGQVRQVCANGGTNTYGVNSVFTDALGYVWVFVGNGDFVRDDGSQTAVAGNFTDGN